MQVCKTEKFHQFYALFFLEWEHLACEMSEWLLFNANSAILQLYHGKNKLIFNEMMMRSALF